MKRHWRWSIAALILAILLGPVAFEQATETEARALTGVRLADVEYTEINFNNERQELRLSGMLFQPQGSGPFPAVVVIHGSGTSVRDNPWYLTLADHLQRNGIAVLLPDKRGSVHSEGDWRTSSFEDLATDTVAAVDFLTDQELLPVSQIGVIGMSQGGQIAPLVAAKSDQISFVINVVGSTVPLYQALIYEETHNLRQIGFLPGIADAIAPASTLYLRRVSQPDFWDAVGNFDPLPYWQQMDIPALALFGEEDSNTPSQQSQARLASLRRDNIQVFTYAGSGHALEDPTGRGNQIFRQDALEAIVDFIKSIGSSSTAFTSPDFRVKNPF